MIEQLDQRLGRFRQIVHGYTNDRQCSRHHLLRVQSFFGIALQVAHFTVKVLCDPLLVVLVVLVELGICDPHRLESEHQACVFNLLAEFKGVDWIQSSFPVVVESKLKYMACLSSV